MKWVLLSINLALVAGYLVVGLYPFNFFPHNEVSWIAGENGIRLGAHSILYSDRDMNLAGEGGGAGIEIYLSAADTQDDSVRPILSLYDGEIPENLLLAQRGPALLLRAAFIDTRGRRRYRELGIRSGIHPDSPRLVTVTSGAGGTAVYLDGVPVKFDANLILRPDNLTGRLLLGNGPGGDHNWRGRLLGAAFFSVSPGAQEIGRHYRKWTESGGRGLIRAPGLEHLYLFDQGEGRSVADLGPGQVELTAPEFAAPMRRTLLLPPWQDTIHLGDVAVNILGFVPFGFFYFLYRAAAHPGSALRNAVIAFLAAAAVSAAIELLQVYLPSRSSSLTDLICNVGGALLGILAAAALPAGIMSEFGDRYHGSLHDRNDVAEKGGAQ